MQKIIDDTKKYPSEYGEKLVKIKSIEEELKSTSTLEEKRKLVRSLIRIVGMTKWDLPQDLYRFY